MSMPRNAVSNVERLMPWLCAVGQRLSIQALRSAPGQAVCANKVPLKSVPTLAITRAAIMFATGLKKSAIITARHPVMVLGICFSNNGYGRTAAAIAVAATTALFTMLVTALTTSSSSA